MSRAKKQVEAVVAVKMLGVASFWRWEDDCCVVRAKCLAAIDQAQKVADEIEASLGWTVVVTY